MTATLAILAGGAGSRMGRPKAELSVAGKPILGWLLDRLQWDGPTLLVTAPGRERPPGAERFGREVTDPARGEGPMRGVLTALEGASTDLVLVVTCDMPRVEARHLAWLAGELARRPQCPLAIIVRDGRPEPFPLAVRRSAIASVRDHFDGGARAVHSLTKLSDALTLAAPGDWPDDVWTNLNTPEDLAAFLAHPDVP